MAKLAAAANNNEMAETGDIVSTNDEKIDKLFQYLLSETEELEDYSVPLDKKKDIITNIEFVLTRIRFLVINELNRVDFTMNEKDKAGLLNDSIKKKFSNRKNFLGSLNNRLNDIREDLNLIEKTMYYNYKY